MPYYFFKSFLENKYNRTLNQLLKEKLLNNIGANNTTYLPLNFFSESRLVPSEVDNYFRQDTLKGYVHDMGAAMQGGIGGHACYYCKEGNRRGLGFDKPQIDDSSPTCGCVPMSSFGHSGFTGTYAWADPDNQIVYVFLSNRTYPSMNNNKLSKNNIRTEIQRIIYNSLK